MDSRAAVARFEAAMSGQVALAAGDPAVEPAARALREALGPAARQLVMDLVPAGCDLEVRAASADVRPEVGLGTLKVDSGDVTAGDIAGNAAVR